jgi:hypothetical protein
MMKTFSRTTKVIALALATVACAGALQAQNLAWTGAVDNDFNNSGNWNGTLSTNGTLQINGPGTQGNSTLKLTAPQVFTATTGKISFGASSGNMGLSGSDITLFQGTGDGILSAVASGNTTTIANNIVLGNGSTVTNSLSSSGTGLLKVTGNISSGTGAVTPGNQTLSFGSTDAQNGNYEVTGNISKGSTATQLFINKRGNGTLTLSGNNEVAQLGSNVAGSKIAIAGGTTNLKPSGETLNNWGGSAGSIIEVRTGGTLNADFARAIRPTLSITGGTVNIAATAPRLDWQSTNAEVFNMSAGEMNFLNASGSTFGVAYVNNSGTQSGGNFTVNGRGASGLTFNVGTASSTANASYSISGGTLDVKGSNSTNGWLNITASTSGNFTSTVALSGTGKLISRFSPGSTGGIVGTTASATAVQVLSLTGGTLVAGRIEAANLRGSLTDANGTIINNGTTFAPGDVTAGLLGRTTINGSFTQTTGTLLFDIGGATASSVFSEAASSGKFDNLLISTNFALDGGSIRVNLVNGFENTITALETFKIVDVTTGASTFSGSFAALTTGNMTLNAYVGNDVVGTFTLSNVSNDLVLSNYAVIPEPATWVLLALGLTTAVVLRRRSRA